MLAHIALVGHPTHTAVAEGGACFEQGEEGRTCVLPVLRLLMASPEASLQINPGCLDPTKVQKGSSSPERSPELGEVQAGALALGLRVAAAWGLQEGALMGSSTSGAGGRQILSKQGRSKRLPPAGLQPTART